MKLVIFEMDWANEFSPFGFALMTPEQLEEFKTFYSKPQGWYFGTNEGWEDDGSDIIFEGCKVKDVTLDEAEFLKKLFDIPEYSWDYPNRGLFPAKPENN